MNRDLINLLKSVYKNANDRNHHMLKLDKIVATFNQNKLNVEQMMLVEEGILKDRVSQAIFVLFSWTFQFLLDPF